MKYKNTTPSSCPWKMGTKMSREEYLKAKITIYNEGKIKIGLADIMRIEGCGSYSLFHMSNGKILKSSYGLSHYMPLLPEGIFGRYCDSFIINLEYVLDFTKGQNWSAVMEDRTKTPYIKVFIPICRACRAKFEQDYNKYW